MPSRNRLSAEGSRYLQLHADNPVDWYPWGDEALGRARQEDRLIFLSSGYASCHWCHVMEREVFTDAAVASFLDRHFVSIKVDREERPDIDATYMQAALVLTGSGGWPLSVFLTPDLQPFHAGTYIPRDRFLALLARIVEVYRDRRDHLRAQAAEVSRHVLAAPEAAGEDLDDGLFAAAVAGARASFDEANGGLATQQKFPVPIRWRFLLHHWRRSGDLQARGMVERTLDAMAQGGLRDHLGGGFHRYTVDATWTVPHFEKMLYDNAQLAALYVESGAALARADLLDVGTQTLDFLCSEMREPEGGFVASLDADSDGEEGAFYVWTPAQIAAELGDDDGAAIADLLGVQPASAGVLTRRLGLDDVAARHGRDPAGLRALLPRALAALQAARARRTPPARDAKVITAWNGLAISALACAAAVTGSSRYLDAAAAAVRFLRARHRRDDGTLVRASTAGIPAGEGILDDYALLATGLLDLYQVSGGWEHLTWAGELLSIIRSQFARAEGAFYQTRAGVPTPLGRRVEIFDSVLPSGCAAAIGLMVRFGALAGDVALAAEARGQLRGMAATMRRAGTDLAGWLDAAMLAQGPLYTVVVAGDDGGPLARAALATWPPQAVVARVPATGLSAAAAQFMPGLAGKTATAGALAFVCREGACEPPTADGAEVAQAIRKGWVR